jgi:hypothetical protein
MAIKIRKTASQFEADLMTAYNVLVDANLSTEVHRDKTCTETGDSFNPTGTPLLVTGVTTDLTTCEALAEEIRGVLGFHFIDHSAHEVVDDVNVAFADYDGYYQCTDLATTIALANAEKVCYNAHMSQSTVHVNNDVTNTVTAADADDLAKVKTLLADLKAKINAHMTDAGATQRYLQVPA